MYKFVVLTDPNTAAGFRMAGLEAYEAASVGEASHLLLSLLKDEDAGIIAVNEEFMEVIDERMNARIKRSYRPIVIPIPGRTRRGEGLSSIERLLRKAIGYNIVLRR